MVGEFEQARGDDGVLPLFGDSSGGIHSDDPRRRRVGAGFCSITFDPEAGTWSFEGGMVGGVPARQTVPRAELLAFALALEASRGNIVFYTDNRGPFLAWRARRHVKPLGLNGDLWARIKKALSSRGAHGPEEVQVE